MMNQEDGMQKVLYLPITTLRRMFEDAVLEVIFNRLSPEIVLDCNEVLNVMTYESCSMSTAWKDVSSFEYTQLFLNLKF